MTTSKDLLAVVEAAYRLDQSDDGWLEALPSLRAVDVDVDGERSVRFGRTAGAREALRRAVLSSERARGSMRSSDPVDALELWQALVAGRWSLVEHFDTDGHRYLVARRNDPGVRDPRCPHARGAHANGERQERLSVY